MIRRKGQEKIRRDSHLVEGAGYYQSVILQLNDMENNGSRIDADPFFSVSKFNTREALRLFIWGLSVKSVEWKTSKHFSTVLVHGFTFNPDFH